MADIIGRVSLKNVIVSGDYKAADPTAVVLQRGSGTGLVVTLTPSLLSGAGCTVTLTATNTDTGAAIGSPLVVTAAAAAVLVLANLSPAIHRVTLTPVGSGTRTTLTYQVDALWSDVLYGPGFYWDGAKYASSEGQTP